MEDSDLETVRAAFQGWAEDRPTRQHFDPDVEVLMPHPGMSASGFEEMGVAMRDFRNMWDSYEIELEGVQRLADGRVIAFFTERVRGAASGIEQVARPGVICTLRDGKIVRFEAHLRREDALRAAGLHE